MNPTELKQMRTKQVVATNILVITMITIYFILTVTGILPITYLFLALGILLLGQAIIGLLKRDPIKSIIPIFEEVAIYEKKKMGDEWKKQQRMSHILRVFISGMMFLQAYWHHDSVDKDLQFDFSFIFFFIVLMLVLINISLWMHIRKIDRSKSELDLKGYTWKMGIKSVLLGIAFAFIIIIFTIWFITTRI